MTRATSISLLVVSGFLACCILQKPAGAANLFYDEFSGDLSKWEVAAGTWEIRDGWLHGTGDGGQAWAFAGSESWTDYSIETRARFDTGNAFIAFRSTGNVPRGHAYSIDLWPEGGTYSSDYEINRDVPPGRSMKRAHWVRPIPNPVTIRVDVTGNTIRLYFDGAFVNSVTDPNPLPAGGLDSA